MSERPGTAEPDALRKPEPEAQSKVAPGRSSKAATTSPRKIDTASEEKLSWWKRLFPHFSGADFLFCLADAFLGESLLALLLFSGETGLFEKAHLGRSFLPLQLAAFFVLFLIFALLRARFERAPRESQTILLANLYYLGLAFWPLSAWPPLSLATASQAGTCCSTLAQNSQSLFAFVCGPFADPEHLTGSASFCSHV